MAEKQREQINCDAQVSDLGNQVERVLVSETVLGKGQFGGENTDREFCSGYVELHVLVGYGGKHTQLNR